MDGEPIPARVPLETRRISEEYNDGIWALIEVDVSKLCELDRTRVNLTVPERVLDKMAAHEGENRSGLLARAALSYAERQSTQ